MIYELLMIQSSMQRATGQTNIPGIPDAIPDGKVVDYIDQNIRSDTPEEYVRQNIERRLVLELKYEPNDIEVEFAIRMGSQRKRVDLAIFSSGMPHTQDNIWIIIECKQESQDPSSKQDGVDQLKSYLSACSSAEWGLWTNGRYKWVCRRRFIDGKTVWDEPNDIPAFGSDPSEIDRPSRQSLGHAVEDNLLFSFKICHDHIYVTDGLQKQPAFFELLKVIFCKIYDERNVPNELEFYATSSERASNDGRLTVSRRMSRIFRNVKKRYSTIFDAKDEIQLQPRSLSYIVGELQRYSFLGTNIDVKGKAYEELVGANLRGDRGEFFTPRNVQQMAVSMLDIKDGEVFLDPACGTGGFPVIAMNATIERLRKAVENSGFAGAAAQEAIRQRVDELAKRCFFGLDINPDLVKATKMNMVMNNDGSGNVLRQDSLLHPHQWEGSFREELADAIGIDVSTLRGPGDIGHFDVIGTNPPFGSKLPIKDAETLGQYSLGHVWKKTREGWLQTANLQNSQPPEILFIERCWQFLKPGGRMAIVLPDAILGAPSLGYVRQWILENCRLIASIDLHPDTFQPRNGTQTSILILERKTERDRQRGSVVLDNYSVFMAEVRAMGHDKRGNKVYQRNEEGEEILVEATILGSTENSAPRARQKVLDDDTNEIAERFLAWKKKEVVGW